MTFQVDVWEGRWDFFGLTIPYYMAPFVSCLIIQLLVPNASFIGHLSGIFAGMLISFSLFEWFTGGIFWFTFILISSFLAYNGQKNIWKIFSVATANLSSSGGLEGERESGGNAQNPARIVGGVIVRTENV